MLEIITSLFLAVASIWLGSIEVRMRNLDERMREGTSRKDVNELVDLKQESLKVLQIELKEDIKQLRDRLDHILDKIND